MCSCSLIFPLLLVFTLVAASISHFLTAPFKFSCFCSNKIGLLCFLSLAVRLFLFPHPPGLHEGVDVCLDDFLRTQISWIHR